MSRSSLAASCRLAVRSRTAETGEEKAPASIARWSSELAQARMLESPGAGFPVPTLSSAALYPCASWAVLRSVRNERTSSPLRSFSISVSTPSNDEAAPIVSIGPSIRERTWLHSSSGRGFLHSSHTSLYPLCRPSRRFGTTSHKVSWAFRVRMTFSTQASVYR
jgi:hypothetical protein